MRTWACLVVMVTSCMAMVTGMLCLSTAPQGFAYVVAEPLHQIVRTIALRLRLHLAGSINSAEYQGRENPEAHHLQARFPCSPSKQEETELCCHQ